MAGGGLNRVGHKPAENNYVTDKNKPKDKHDGRNIDTAEIGYSPADGTQCGFRQTAERIGYQVDGVISAVYDIERDQPAQDRADDNRPDIKRYDHRDKL
jgi:hypothetical protein